jgi:hypothetical protein
MFRARAPLVALAAAALLTSCGGTEVARPSPPTSRPVSESPSPSPTPPQSPSASPSPTASLEPTIRIPKDAPRTYAQDVPVEDLPPDALVPPDAIVTASSIRRGDEVGDGISLAWARGDDPFAAERGLVVWQRFDERPAWRVVYGSTDPPARGVLGIRLEPGDVTGDGVDDLLSFEETGGSGACGTWRVIVTGDGAAADVGHLRACDTQVRFARAGIEVREAVFEPGDAHCCPSAYRISRLRWDGETLTEVRSTVSPAPASA